MLTIRVVNPGDDRALVTAFMACQARIYAEFGTEKAALRVTHDEIDDGNVCIVVAQDERGDLVGGLNFCLRRPGMMLPTETLLEEDPRMQAFSGLRAKIARWSTRGLAESSGLWAVAGWRGTGLSVAMFRVLIAAMPSFGVRRSIAFTHQHVLKTWGPIGWREDLEVRRIPYPDHRYQSSVIWLDPVNLDDANEKQRDHIFHLRDVLKRGGTIRWPLKERHPAPLLEARG